MCRVAMFVHSIPSHPILTHPIPSHPVYQLTMVGPWWFIICSLSASPTNTASTRCFSCYLQEKDYTYIHTYILYIYTHLQESLAQR